MSKWTQALQQALKNLERACTNFFQKRADFPKFKKKGQRESFRIPQGFEVDNQNGRIKLPKLGWVRYRIRKRCWASRRTSPSANRAASRMEL